MDYILLHFKYPRQNSSKESNFKGTFQSWLQCYSYIALLTNLFKGYIMCTKAIFFIRI